MSSTEPLVLTVLHEDEHLYIVDKPAGLPVQADRTGDADLLGHVQGLFSSSGSAIGLPHRLDRPVSGVLVFTKTPEALRGMNDRFRDGEVRKSYWALVEGRSPAMGECKHHVEHTSGSRKAKIVATGTVEGKEAVLRYVTLAHGDRFSLMEVKPVGGAFHQIRAQLSAIRHPIKGDVKYGARRGEPDRSIGLHACRMIFQHPITQLRMDIVAPDPARSIWPAMLALRTPGS